MIYQFDLNDTPRKSHLTPAECTFFFNANIEYLPK